MLTVRCRSRHGTCPSPSAGVGQPARRQSRPPMKPANTAVPEGLRRLRVVARRGGVVQAADDWVAEEVPVALVFNGISHAVMMATPADLEDFARGFCATEGLADAQELRSVEAVPGCDGIELHLEVSAACEWRLRERRRTLAGRTGCGLCGTESLAEAVRPVGREAACIEIEAAALERAMAALPKAAHPGAKRPWPRSTKPKMGPRHHRESVRRRVLRQAAPSRREDHRRPRRPGGVLRLPARALGPPTHHEPNRVHLRHSQAPATHHQRARLKSCRHSYGLQADRGRPNPLAHRQRPPPRRPRPRRGPLHGKRVERPDQSNTQPNAA